MKAKADQFTESEVPMTLFLIILCGLGLVVSIFWILDGEDSEQEDRRKRALRHQGYRYSDGSDNIFDVSRSTNVWHHDDHDGGHDAHSHGDWHDISDSHEGGGCDDGYDGGDGGGGGGFDGDCGGGDF